MMKQIFPIRIHHYGDDGLLAEFEPQGQAGIGEHLHQQLQAQATIMRHSKKWLDVVPGFSSLTVRFDLTIINPADAMKRFIQTFREVYDLETELISHIIEVPVCYEAPFALDMEQVTQRLGLSYCEFVKHHSAQTYNVSLLGFTPGFAYLGGMDEALATPRLTTPRQFVSAGSVGIASLQTGIYGLDGPGGWSIIGRTPLKLFSPENVKPFLLGAGQKLRFVPISAATFADMATTEGEGV